MKKPKRTIESLKPNECIHIKTEKEAVKLAKLLNKSEYNKQYGKEPFQGSWLFDNKHEFIYLVQGRERTIDLYQTPSEIIIPASDFIGKKKNKTAKRLDRMEKRLSVIEKENDFIANCNAMSAVEEKPFVLPEKWCILIDSLNFTAIGEWFNENRQLDTDYDYTSINGVFLHYPKPEKLAHSSCVIQKGYTEITTEQFIEHVLNRQKTPYELAAEQAQKEEQPKEIDFSIAGQLLESETDGVVIYTTGNYNANQFYGFVIKPSYSEHIGEHGWWMRYDFKLYTREITLKNN